MKVLLLCPSTRPAVAALAAHAPLAAVPLLGESLLAYWLVDLAARGVSDVIVLAADRFAPIQQLAGDGARWGLRVDVRPEPAELSIAEARARYRGLGADDWLPAPDDVVLLDHLPGLPEQCVFENYAAWFVAAQTWMVRALTPVRVGVREIEPGVRVGLHSRVPRDARFIPPCWIGEGVFLGAGVRLGPLTVIEDGAFIEGAALVTRSIVGPATFVGGNAEVRDSIIWGDSLINWRTESHERVPDSLVLGPAPPRWPPAAPQADRPPGPAPIARWLPPLRRLLEYAWQARRGAAPDMPP